MDDVVIVGGGIIGAATAYFLSKEGRKVKVIERDPTYRTASFPLSLGGFRRQFFQTENILLGKFAREFIFQIPELLKTKKNPIEEFDIWKDPAKAKEMLQRTNGARTIPQIFIGDHYIGGNDKLQSANRSGELDKLLS